MNIKNMSSTSPLGAFVEKAKQGALWIASALLMLAAYSNSAHASLQYSYSPDLSPSSPVEGASILPTKVYLYYPNLGANQYSVVCCDWISGPGSHPRHKSMTVDSVGSEVYSVDLSSQMVGSERVFEVDTNIGLELVTFSIASTTDMERAAEPPQSLSDSGPVRASFAGQVIENLRIVANQNSECALTISGYDNVVVRNVYIEHYNKGLCAEDAAGLSISNIKIVSISAPQVGPHCKPGVENCVFIRTNRENPDRRLNMHLLRTPGASVEFFQADRGSSGVSVAMSDDVSFWDVKCFDMRGPYPRGNCVQFVGSNHGSLTNFYSKNLKETSHDLDVISVFRSNYLQVTHGLIDGSFSRNGVGIIADKGSDYMIASDVDFLNTTNSAISVYSGDYREVGKNFTATDIRVKDTSCRTRYGTRPSSGGLVIAIHPHAVNPIVDNLTYSNHCREYVSYCVSAWCRKVPGGSFDIRQDEFEVRDPLELVFPWEAVASEI